MRSSPFLLFSIALHVVAVGALALSPKKLLNLLPQKSNEVEVSLGEPAEKAGVEEAEVVSPQAPAPAPITPKVTRIAEPVKAKEPVKIKAKTAPQAKASVAALLKREVPAPVEATSEAESEAETSAPTEQTDITENANESEGPDTATEASASEAQAEDPAPVGASEEAASEEPETTAQGTEASGSAGRARESESDEEDTKGGATKQSAVSYLGLKQKQGNKPPEYPMTARLERRQGQLELVYRVTSDGTVENISVAKSSGHTDLDTAAVTAVAKFKFYPGQEGWARHPITFALKGPDESIPSKLRTGKQADIE